MIVASPSLDPSRREESLARFDEHMDRFEELSMEHGFLPGVFLVPDPNTLISFPTHPSQALARELVERLEARGIPASYERKSLVERADPDDPSRTIPYDGHYTAFGNELLADMLRQFVRELVVESE